MADINKVIGSAMNKTAELYIPYKYRQAMEAQLGQQKPRTNIVDAAARDRTGVDVSRLSDSQYYGKKKGEQTYNRVNENISTRNYNKLKADLADIAGVGSAANGVMARDSAIAMRDRSEAERVGNKVYDNIYNKGLSDLRNSSEVYRLFNGRIPTKDDYKRGKFGFQTFNWYLRGGKKKYEQALKEWNANRGRIKDLRAQADKAKQQYLTEGVVPGANGKKGLGLRFTPELSNFGEKHTFTDNRGKQTEKYYPALGENGNLTYMGARLLGRNQFGQFMQDINKALGDKDRIHEGSGLHIALQELFERTGLANVRNSFRGDGLDVASNKTMQDLLSRLEAAGVDRNAAILALQRAVRSWASS